MGYHNDFTGEAFDQNRPFKTGVRLKRNRSKLAGPIKVLKPDKDGKLVEVEIIPVEDIMGLPPEVTYRCSLINLIEKSENGEITLVSHNIRALYYLHDMNFIEVLRAECLPAIKDGIKWRDKNGVLKTKYLFNGCKPWNQYDDLK